MNALTLSSTTQQYNCSDYLQYTFEENGLYRFNSQSIVGGEGFFGRQSPPQPSELKW